MCRTFVPIEFAPQERVDAYGELKDDFVRRVLNLDWAFISDESSLGLSDGHEHVPGPVCYP
jgi:hypothetical protein